MPNFVKVLLGLLHCIFPQFCRPFRKNCRLQALEPIFKPWVLYRQIKWFLFSCIGLVRRDHDVVLTDRVVPGLMYGIGEKRPWCCIDRQSGPCSHVWDWQEETMVLHRHRVVHGLMNRVGEKKPWCCIDRQSGPCSHVWDW